MSELDFLYLSEPEMIQAGVLDMPKCVRAVEEAFRLAGTKDYVMGGPTMNSHGVMLWYPEQTEHENMPKAGPDRRYMSMIAYLGGRFNVCGQKWYGSNVANIGRGMPRSILMFSLNDAETGAPLSIMSANLLSAMRTGAIPGVATKYLKRKGAKTAAIIGCGVINHACLLAIAEGLETVETVYLYDINEERAAAYANEMREKVGASFVICHSLEEALRDADVISIATAGKHKVEIKKEWLKKGTLLTVTGTACLPEEMYLNNKIVMDIFDMHKDWLAEGKMHPDGIESIREWASSYDLLRLYEDGKLKDEDITDLGDVVAGKAHPRSSDDETILLVVGGLPIEDVAWGHDVYQSAVEKGIGQKLKIWDSPHWF